MRGLDLAAGLAGQHNEGRAGDWCQRRADHYYPNFDFGLSVHSGALHPRPQRRSAVKDSSAGGLPHFGYRQQFSEPCYLSKKESDLGRSFGGL
jgi:hypothetical protein